MKQAVDRGGGQGLGHQLVKRRRVEIGRDRTRQTRSWSTRDTGAASFCIDWMPSLRYRILA